MLACIFTLLVRAWIQWMVSLFDAQHVVSTPPFTQLWFKVAFPRAWFIMSETADRPTFDSVFSIGRVRPQKRKFHSTSPQIARRGLATLPDTFWGTSCCAKDCIQQFAESAATVARWRRRWRSLNQAERRCAVLEYERNQVVLGHRVSAESKGCSGSLSSCSFLGRPVCRRAWRKLTGVSANLQRKAQRWARAGALRPPAHTRAGAKSVVMDSLHGAIMEIITHMRNRMPLKTKEDDELFMPFSHPIQLFRMLATWYGQSIAKGKPMLPTEPRHQTFMKVLRRPEFRRVRWHRVVDLGRCPKCMLYVYKSMTAPEAHQPTTLMHRGVFSGTLCARERQTRARCLWALGESNVFAGRPCCMGASGQRPSVEANVTKAPILGRPHARRGQSRFGVVRCLGRWRRQ